MLDIETEGTESTSVVVSIGVVAFDPRDWTIQDEFYVVPDRTAQYEARRSYSLDTLNWWSEQSPEVRGVFSAPETPVGSVLRDLTHFLRGTQGVWGNGADFDNVIVHSLFKSFDMVPPWSFGLNRCYRTLTNLQLPPGAVMPSRSGVHHHALDDARYQTQHLMHICQALNLEL